MDERRLHASELPARFVPRQTASAARRVLVFVFGPLLWLVAILVVALFVARGRVVEIALACMLLAFVGGVALSLTGRQLRLREERKVEDA